MAEIVDTANNAFRDFVVDGLPSSGENDPDKSEIRSIFPLIESALAAVGLAGSIVVAYATQAELDADLDHDAGGIGMVYADGDNNGFYVKLGASGAGSWDGPQADLKGPPGPTGPMPNIIAGVGPPSDSDGIEGDYYFDNEVGGTGEGDFYGPKTDDSEPWAFLINLKGAQGEEGPAGEVSRVELLTRLRNLGKHVSEGRIGPGTLADGLAIPNTGPFCVLAKRTHKKGFCWRVRIYTPAARVGSKTLRSALFSYDQGAGTLAQEGADLQSFTVAAGLNTFVLGSGLNVLIEADPNRHFGIEAYTGGAGWIASPSSGGVGVIHSNPYWEQASTAFSGGAVGTVRSNNALMVALDFIYEDGSTDTIGDVNFDAIGEERWVGVHDVTTYAGSGIVRLVQGNVGSGGTNGTFALGFSGGGGSGAAGTFTVAGGVMTAINLTAKGTGYTSAPTVSMSASAGLTGAAVTAVRGTGLSNTTTFTWVPLPIGLDGLASWFRCGSYQAGEMRVGFCNRSNEEGAKAFDTRTFTLTLGASGTATLVEAGDGVMPSDIELGKYSHIGFNCGSASDKGQIAIMTASGNVIITAGKTWTTAVNDTMAGRATITQTTGDTQFQFQLGVKCPVSPRKVDLPGPVTFYDNDFTGVGQPPMLNFRGAANPAWSCTGAGYATALAVGESNAMLGDMYLLGDRIEFHTQVDFQGVVANGDRVNIMLDTASTSYGGGAKLDPFADTITWHGGLAPNASSLGSATYTFVNPFPGNPMGASGTKVNVRTSRNWRTFQIIFELVSATDEPIVGVLPVIITNDMRMWPAIGPAAFNLTGMLMGRPKIWVEGNPGQRIGPIRMIYNGNPPRLGKTVDSINWSRADLFATCGYRGLVDSQYDGIQLWIDGASNAEILLWLERMLRFLPSLTVVVLQGDYSALNTQANQKTFDQLVDFLDDRGITLVLKTLPPEPAGGGIGLSPYIIDVAETRKFRLVPIHITHSLNNDGITHDPSLRDSDLLHYNNAGHAKEYWADGAYAGDIIRLFCPPTIPLHLTDPLATTAQLFMHRDIGDLTTNITVGDGKDYWVVPPQFDGRTLSNVLGSLVGQVSNPGIVTIQVARVRAGVAVDMLTTALTIDANERDSLTAATAFAVDATNGRVLTGDWIRADIDGAGTNAKGLKLVYTF